MSSWFADLVTLGAAFSTGWRACRQYHIDIAVEGAHYTSIPSYTYAMRSSVSSSSFMPNRHEVSVHRVRHGVHCFAWKVAMHRLFWLSSTTSLNCRSHLDNQDSGCVFH